MSVKLTITCGDSKYSHKSIRAWWSDPCLSFLPKHSLRYYFIVLKLHLHFLHRRKGPKGTGGVLVSPVALKASLDRLGCSWKPWFRCSRRQSHLRGKSGEKKALCHVWTLPPPSSLSFFSRLCWSQRQQSCKHLRNSWLPSISCCWIHCLFIKRTVKEEEDSPSSNQPYWSGLNGTSIEFSKYKEFLQV